MKHLLALTLILINIMPLSALEKPKSSSKLPLLGTCGLYGFIGWSAYEFIKDIKHRKLYANDFSKLDLRYLKKSELKQEENIINQEVKNSGYYQDKAYSMDLYTAKWRKYIENGDIAPLYVAFINKTIGYGAFADKDIQKGEFIGTYTGKIYNQDDLQQVSKAEARLTGLYCWTLPNPLIVDAFKQGNELRFVNHSDEPNVKIKYVPVNDQWHLVYVAEKPIVKDEQLLVSYGSRYWRTDNKPEPLNEKHRFYQSKDLIKKYFEKYL